jgi:hypothetical protein
MLNHLFSNLIILWYLQAAQPTTTLTRAVADLHQGCSDSEQSGREIHRFRTQSQTPTHLRLAIREEAAERDYEDQTKMPCLMRRTSQLLEG